MRNLIRFTTVLAVFVMVATGAVAQRWVRFDGPPGATYTGLAVSSANPEIIATQIQGSSQPYYTTNGGTTWQQMSPFPDDWWGYSTTALSFVPGTQQTIRMLFDAWIVETSNFGATWQKVSTLPNNTMRNLMVHPTDKNLWFTWGMSPPVLRSTNAGAHWDTVFASTLLGLSNVVVSPAAPQHMYLEVKDSMYESIDTGRTWRKFAYTGVLNYSVNLLAADATIADQLYGYFQGRLAVSTDRGRTWIDKTQKNILTVSGITQEVSNSSVLYAWGTNVHRSSDHGNTWTTVDTTHTTRLSAVLHQGQLYVGCYQSGIFRSSNNGTSWDRLDRGINRLDIQRIVALNDRTWFVQGVNDVIKTTDGGESWTFLTPATYDQPSGGRVYSFDVALSNPMHMVGGTNSDIYRSSDGGIAWQGASPSQNEPIGSITIHPTDPDQVICGGLYNLKRSTDGGKTWKNDVANSHRSILAIARNPVAPSHVIAAEGSNTYSTIDNGSRWTKHAAVMNEPQTVIGDANDANTFYMSGSSGVMKSVDNGDSWTRPWALPYAAKALVQDPRNSDHLWVSYAGGRGDLVRLANSTAAVDTLYAPDYTAETFSLNDLVVVGNRLIGGSYNGLVWFDPTPVSVQEVGAMPACMFQPTDVLRRDVMNLQGVLIGTDMLFGSDQNKGRRIGNDPILAQVPAGVYLVRLTNGQCVVLERVLHLP